MNESDRQVRSLALRRRRVAQLLSLYLAVLALIVFWPSPVDPGASSGMLSDVLRSLHRRGMPGWINYAMVESVANVLLFVPFGLLAASWFTDRWTWLVAAQPGCQHLRRERQFARRRAGLCGGLRLAFALPHLSTLPRRNSSKRISQRSELR